MEFESFLEDQRRIDKDWNWWSNFLQREYYGNPGEMKAWELTVRSIARELNITPGQTVLDLGSGCGEVTLRMALRGARAIGVERSEELVRYCRRVAVERGIMAEFIAADMFTYQPDTELDAVLSLNTSFGYGSDEQNRRLIARIGSWLKPGGLFYCDLFTADHAEPFGEWSDVIADGRLVVDNTYDPEQQVMISHPAWIAPDEQTVYYATEPERIKLYTRTEMEAMMTEAGMEPRRLRRAMGRRFDQTDDQMHTTWVARKIG